MKLHNPLPESLAIQCEKAASILEHFVKGKTKLDAAMIPSKILEKARGVAIITIVKAGFLWSGRAGSGIVVARLPDGSWSAPSSIMAFGAGVGAQIGAEISDYVFVLNNAAAVRAFGLGGNLVLGGNISVAAGPTGRATEAAGTVINPAPMYSYSKSKGVFAGVSVEGTIIITRVDANRKAYGINVRTMDILTGIVPQPIEADPLYRMLGCTRFANIGKRMIAKHNGGSMDDSNKSPVSTFGRGALTIRYRHSMDASKPVSDGSGVRGSQSTMASSPTSIIDLSKTNRSSLSNPKSSTTITATALYDYVAERDGDLSFKRGDKIVVTRSTTSQHDWWTGNINGLTGEFPANYVEVA